MKKGTKKTLESSDSRNKLEVNAADAKKSHTKTKESHHRSKEPQKTRDKYREHRSRDRDSKEKEHKSKEKSVVAAKKTQEELEEKPSTTTLEKVNGEKEHERVLHEDTAAIGRHVTKYGKDLRRNIKPPVVLVYADSAIAKDNVKQVLHEILNREKYTIYAAFYFTVFPYTYVSFLGIQCMIFPLAA